MKCASCNIALEDRTVRFRYLEYEFTHDVPCCPSCGMVYIAEDLASGRMKELEQTYEDK